MRPCLHNTVVPYTEALLLPLCSHFPNLSSTQSHLALSSGNEGIAGMKKNRVFALFMVSECLEWTSQERQRRNNFSVPTTSKKKVEKKKIPDDLCLKEIFLKYKDFFFLLASAKHGVVH